MCSDANCQHTKYDPNKPASLSTEDQAALWADIKAARKAMAEHAEFLDDLGCDATTKADSAKMIKLEALTKSLWARFRVL